MRKTKTCRNACSELSVILKLCSGIIVLEAAAMLHDSDAEFTIIDSVHKAKSRRKYQIVFKKKYRHTGISVPIFQKTNGTGNGTKKVPRYVS